MHIVATSDTHERHDALFVPDGDVFIHAGDFTMIGELDQIACFNDWLFKLPHKYKVVIAGNHDRTLDIINTEGASTEEARKYGAHLLPAATHYLVESGCEIEGRKFWGSPYTPFFGSDYWKFNYDRAVVGKWAGIPEKLDVLMTHGPALGHLDKTLEGVAAGCFDLRRTIADLHLTDDQPRFHIFGHIHEAYGVDDRAADSGRTVLANVSAVDRQYRPRENPCFEFDL